MSKIQTVLVILLACLVFDSLAQERDSNFLIFLDAGHGGRDPGTSGSEVRESTVALALTDKVAILLRQHDPVVSVRFTRERHDQFVELLERTKLANRAGADLFVSIHCNAGANPATTGSETYVLGFNPMGRRFATAQMENRVILKENSYRQRYQNFDPDDPSSHIVLANLNSSYTHQSLLLASSIEGEFGDRSRGVHQSGFIVLAHAAMPSVLVEAGFLSNREEEAYLTSELGQWQVARAIYRGLVQYLEQASL